MVAPALTTRSACGERGTAQNATSLRESLSPIGGVVPDHRTARPSSGGYRDRTGDLLLAKAQNPVHQGAPQGTEPGAVGDAAAAAATRKRTAPESLRETRGAWHAPFTAAQVAAAAADLYGVATPQIDWPAVERHARALDRSEAQHILRTRDHQTTRAQAHVRTAVGW